MISPSKKEENTGEPVWRCFLFLLLPACITESSRQSERTTTGFFASALASLKITYELATHLTQRRVEMRALAGRAASR